MSGRPKWEPQSWWRTCGDRECPQPYCYQYEAWEAAVEAWEEKQLEAQELAEQGIFNLKHAGGPI